jgi:hypothetical protein
MSKYGAVVEYMTRDPEVGGSNPTVALFLSMNPDNIRGKYTLIYGNMYLKIPRHSKLRENSHLSMEICMWKFPDIQNMGNFPSDYGNIHM